MVFTVRIILLDLSLIVLVVSVFARVSINLGNSGKSLY